MPTPIRIRLMFPANGRGDIGRNNPAANLRADASGEASAGADERCGTVSPVGGTALVFGMGRHRLRSDRLTHGSR